ncbi:MAG: SpoIVB peptidase [Oscillibacter sp.]
MYEPFQKTKRGLRGGAVFCLSLLFCATALLPMADAVDLNAAPNASAVKTLVPVGHTVGIKLFSRGVVVVKLSDGPTPAKSAGVQTGDVLLKCNGANIASTEQFQSLLQSGGGETAHLQLRRGSTGMTLAVSPAQNEAGDWNIGAWIRDSMAGIGTMTFYDPASGVFGALGHGITDCDTAILMPFSSGSILPSTVKAVKRGEAGEAGELRGDFDLSGDLGNLYANTDSGIFGTLAASAVPGDAQQALPVADSAEVRPGRAVIRSNVEGTAVEEYDVEILKVLPHATDGRDLLISVTDPALLTATGGIVQGMSGSPILQNGKFVGAVTHVLLNDPTKGYGILIENMLEDANLQHQPVA